MSGIGEFWQGAALALVAAIGLPFAIAAGLHLEGRYRRWVIPTVVALIAIVPPLAVAISGRDLGRIDFLAQVAPGGAEAWLLRLTTASIVFIALVRVVARAFRGRRPGVDDGGLYAAFVAFFIGNVVLSALFGATPGIALPMFYPLLVVTAIGVSRHYPLDDVLAATRWGLLALMVASLVLLAARPTLVAQYAAEEVRLPGAMFRLWGLGSNPNSIAPLALLLILLTLHRGFGIALLNLLAIAAGGAVLLLAQSQTTWIAAAVALLIVAATWIRARLQAGARRRPVFDARGALLTIGALSIAVVAFAYVSTRYGTGAGVIEDFLEALTAGSRGHTNTNLSGRTRIWQIAFQVFADNPVFGYGPGLWSPDFRASWQVPYAFHAHNQFIQSIAAAGLIGLATLLLYLGVAMRLAWRAAGATKGLSLALLATILIRSLTEVPLGMSTVLLGDFLFHALVFAILAGAGEHAARRAAAHARRERHERRGRRRAVLAQMANDG